MSTNKTVHVIGGGTVSHIRTHLALVPPELGAFATGETARRIAALCREHDKTMDVVLTLTAMADPQSTIKTNEDMRGLAKTLVEDPRTKIVFFNPAICDFEGEIEDVPSGKYAERLRTSDDDGKDREYVVRLRPAPKIIRLFRRGEEGWTPRKDIFLVGFKATAGATEEEQYRQGLRALKTSSANLILANDVVTRVNMVIVPEEATYHVTKDREVALRGLVEMAYLRSHLTFTRSTVIDGQPVPWESDLVPKSLRTVIDFCIERGAYKQFLGVTAGHFAVKLDDTTFLTSRRRTDYNEMKKVGLVKVKTDGPDSVIAYGSKPSVGGQSQRIVFREHPDADCIVHFHCPRKVGSPVPVVSQREFECGSHQCGANTSQGLRKFGNLLAVYLDQHGPNIVFPRSIDPKEVIDFIEANFALSEKTGGYAL